MADYQQPVIPDSLPTDLDQENDAMPTPKWAQDLDLEQRLAKLEAHDASLKAAHAKVSQLQDLTNTQAQAIAALELEVKRAHDRLDKARDVIMTLNGTQTRQASTKARPQKPAQDSTREFACSVPNAHGDEEVTHTRSELNACWQNFYAAKS